MSYSADTDKDHPRDMQFLEKLESLVEDKVDAGEFSIEQISSKLGMSSSTFYRKVKERTGSSPVEYIRELKLVKAADLLSSNFGNVSEVAYESGFNNLSYFSKCFREKYGITPARYSKLRLQRKSSETYLTSFIGREEEIRELRSLIDRHRLINVTGPAGTGKTRLALETVKQVREGLKEGAHAVYLASISDHGLVPSTILRSLQIPQHPLKTAMQTLVGHLRTRELLLLLDNFEHVTGAAPKINTLLQQCPGLAILVTSRVTLQLTGEVQYPLHPLATPEPVETVDQADIVRIRSYPALRLFTDRARQVNTDFDVTVDNAPEVIAICRKLDGLPLALELAAAQIKLVSPAELFKRLDAGLSILRSDQLDRSGRHDSLSKAIAWSYDLLEEQVQFYFQKLALVPGSFSLNAAEALQIDTKEYDFFDALRSLSDKNLIQTYEDEGEIRFKLLEVLKMFGRDKLSENRKEQRAVRDLGYHYLDLAREAEKHLNGPGQKKWIHKLNKEVDNFTGVLTYLEQHNEVRLGLQLSTALWRYWNMQNLNKLGRDWLLRMTNLANRMKQHEMTAEVYELMGKALSALGIVELLLSYHEDSEEHVRQSLTVFRKLDNQAELANNLNHYGWLLAIMGDYNEAISISKEALTLNKKINNKRGISVSLSNLAFVANMHGDLERAQKLYSEGISIRKEIVDRRGEAYLSTRLARVEQRLGEFESVFELLNYADGILRELNDNQLISWHDAIKGLAYYNLGDFEKAGDLQEKAIEGWTEVGNRWGLAFSCDIKGLALLARDEQQTAKKYLDRAGELWENMSCKYMSALSDYCLAEWEVHERNGKRALELHRKSLNLRMKLGVKPVICESLEALARLFLHMQEYKLSADCLSATSALRGMIKAPVPPRFEEDNQKIISGCKNELGAQAFEKHWEEGKQMDLEGLVELI